MALHKKPGKSPDKIKREDISRKNLNELFTIFKEIVQGIGEDFEKLVNNQNKAAGTRSRKGLQNLKTLATVMRLKIQDEIKNHKKDKPKAKKK